MTLSTDVKPIWTSQTVWGSLAAIGASVSTAIWAYKTGDTGTALTAVVGAFGGLTALVGRIKATSQIGMVAQTVISIADQAVIDYAASKAQNAQPPSSDLSSKT
jgi:hypothetical protein